MGISLASLHQNSGCSKVDQVKALQIILVIFDSFLSVYLFIYLLINVVLLDCAAMPYSSIKIR